jgi:serine/threonine protein kinase
MTEAVNLKDFQTEDLIEEEYTSLVYKATYNKKSYVIKKVPKVHTQMSLQIIKRMVESECKILSELDHENIIKLEYKFDDEDNYYLIFPYSGIDLFKYLKEKGKLSESEVYKYVCVIADIIGYLHNKLVVHRDIKLENFLIDPKTLKITLIDFGFAGVGESFGANLGTPDYMAPEVTSGTYNHKIDIYSFGCVIYAMLFNFLPQYQKRILVFYTDVRTISVPMRNLVSKMLRINKDMRIDISEVKSILNEMKY